MNKVKPNKGMLDVLEKEFGVKNRAQLDRYLCHKKIKYTQICSDKRGQHLVVTTKRLRFKPPTQVANDSDYQHIDLGGYKILIPGKTAIENWVGRFKERIRIVNYSYNVGPSGNRQRNHICVYTRGSYFGKPCWGRTMGEYVRMLLKNGQYLPLIYQIINFLEEPGKVSEMGSILAFRDAEKSHIRPRDQMKWFDLKTYEEN